MYIYTYISCSTWVLLGGVDQVRLLAAEDLLEEELLDPVDAVDRLVWVVADRADWVRLLRHGGVALEALGLALEDGADLGRSRV